MMIKDLQLKNKKLFDLIQIENKNQIDKWGIQCHSPCEWQTIIAEEQGELAKELLEDHFNINDISRNNKIIKESIQVATLCLKVAEMYLKRNVTNDDN